jgi:hypothetical protein
MLDLVTLFAATGIIDTAGTVLFLVLWSRHRTYPGLLMLAIGMGVLATGIWLQLLRPLLPPALGIIAANTGANLGHAIMLIAVYRIVGRPGPVGVTTLGFLGATAAFIYFTLVEPSNIVIRVIIVSMVIGTCLLASAWALFRASSPQSRVIHLALGGSILFAGLFMYARAAVTYAQGHVAEMLTSHPIHIGILLVGIVIGFIYMVGFALLISHRLQAQVDHLDMMDNALSPQSPRH